MQQIQRNQIEQMQQVMSLFNPFLRSNHAADYDKDARIRALEAEIERLKAGRH